MYPKLLNHATIATYIDTRVLRIRQAYIGSEMVQTIYVGGSGTVLHAPPLVRESQGYLEIPGESFVCGS